MWQYTSLVWPFMLFGFCYIIWNWVAVWRSDRREKSAQRMDSAAITRRDEFFEENPWRAN